MPYPIMHVAKPKVHFNSILCNIFGFNTQKVIYMKYFLQIANLFVNC